MKLWHQRCKRLIEMEYDIYRYPCLKEFSLFSMKQVFKTTLGDVIKLCQILLL